MSRIGVFTKKRKHLLKNRLFIVTSLTLSFLLIISSIILLILYFNTNKKVPFSEKENPIIYDNAIYKNGQAFIENDEIYLPFTFLKEKIDSGIMYDQESNTIIFTTKDKIIQFPNEKLQYFVNEEPFSIHMPALVKKDGTMYVAATPLLTIYPYKMDFSAETGAVILQKHGDTLLPGTVSTSGSMIRVQESTGLFSPYVAEVSNGEKITVEKDVQSYFFIRKSNGVGGFVKKESISLSQPIVVQVEVSTNEEKSALPKLQWPINLTWEAVYSKNPDLSKIQDIPGLNVISPSWFYLLNEDGDVGNSASLDYVKWAKSEQYQVWGLFSNSFEPERTHAALKDFKTRQKIIRQLLQYANMYQLNGVNIDFENVNVEDRDLVTQFVKELTVGMHRTGLIVSMDITFISSSGNWSQFYDREKLAHIVDYLIVMAYDEHWGNSPVAGSVASLPWVENNLKKLLEVIPNERLILGIPTYTRIWKEQTTPGGNIEVSSKAYSMDDINKWIKEHGLTLTFDEKTGQDYAEYFDEKEKAHYKVWVENDKSIQKRSSLIHQYQLAGIASWNRSFANEKAWKTIHQSLQQIELVQK